MHKFSLINSSSQEGGDLGQQLFQLQVEQLAHDEEFHKEICRLSVHHRINHMALHFAKYAGRFLEAEQSKDTGLYVRTIVDTFIISMVSANIFNLKLSDQFPDLKIQKCDTLSEATSLMMREFGMQRYERQRFFENFVIHTGLLAKACEAIDHLEDYSFKQEICLQVSRIYKLAIIAAVGEGSDLFSATRARLSDVKKKSIFYGL